MVETYIHQRDRVEQEVGGRACTALHLAVHFQPQAKAWADACRTRARSGTGLHRISVVSPYRLHMVTFVLERDGVPASLEPHFAAAGRVSLREAGGPGSGVVCLHASAACV